MAQASLFSAHFILFAVLATPLLGFEHFMDAIPNGRRIPNPCDSQSIWRGVGHTSPDGKTTRNSFGMDFKRAGYKWTFDLCMLDSDGDGRSNGVELGDPACQWSQGVELPQTSTVTHPGICEPVGSQKCSERNKWLNCEAKSGVHCDTLDKNGTITRDLRLSLSSVPSEETTYFCQLFDLDLDSDMHMVSLEPFVTTPKVVHHILLFGCYPEAQKHVAQMPRSPYACNMMPNNLCRSLIGAWTLGSDGECMHPKSGIRMGPRGYRTVAMQVHWNNPDRLKGLVDSSGLTIRLSPNLRQFDAGMLVIGQRYLQIEPRSRVEGYDVAQSELSFSASCPGKCTKLMFKSTIYLTAAVNHMHYLGIAQRIEQYRNNTLVRVITDQNDYSYDDPLFYHFQEAIAIHPGDELRTTCTYKPTSSEQPVCWGEATSDEMCFGFLTYYPMTSLSHPWCTSMMSLPSCERHLPSLQQQPIGGCRWWEFRDERFPETDKMIRNVYAACYDKEEELVCSKGCKKVVQGVMENPCMKGDMAGYMIDRLKKEDSPIPQVLDALITCSCRQFPYCVRVMPSGMLGAAQKDFCSGAAMTRLSKKHFSVFFILALFLSLLQLQSYSWL